MFCHSEFIEVETSNIDPPEHISYIDRNRIVYYTCHSHANFEKIGPWYYHSKEPIMRVILKVNYDWNSLSRLDGKPHNWSDEDITPIIKEYHEQKVIGRLGFRSDDTKAMRNFLSKCKETVNFDAINDYYLILDFETKTKSIMD